MSVWAAVAGGAAVLPPSTRRFARWWLLGLLLTVFPANVHMALHPERYPQVPGGKATLYARLPRNNFKLHEDATHSVLVAGGIANAVDVAALMKKESVYAYSYKGIRYDCGSKEGFLQANVDWHIGVRHLDSSQNLLGIVNVDITCNRETQ